MTIGQLEEFNSTLTFVVDDKKILCPRFAYVNGELKSEFYEIQNNDSIQMENYYTVEQLFTFLDYDISQYDVYVNNELADDDTYVYENFNIKLSAVNNDVNNDIDDIDDIDNVDDVDDVDSYPDINDNEHESDKSSADISEITVLINGNPVRLKGKHDYILVDLFQYYEFDLSNPQGNIVLNLNGQTGEYTAPLKDGDVIDLYWEK